MDLTDRTDAVAAGGPPHRWWLAVLASMVVPGSGHLILRRWRRAGVFGAAVVVLALGAGAVVARGPIGVIELIVQPSGLWAVFGFNAVLAIVRLGAAVDVYRLSRPRGAPAGVLAAAIISIGLVPQVVVGLSSLQGIDVLESVFAGEGDAMTPERLVAEGFTVDDFGPPAPRTSTTTTTLPPVPVTIRPNVPADQVKLLIPSSDRNPVRPVILPSDPVFFDAPFEPDRLGSDRITVLLAGGDAGPGRFGLRTDVMMVATFDPATKSAAIFGIPRNLARTPLPDWMARSFFDLEDRFGEAEAQAAAATTTTPGEDPSTTVAPPQRCGCFVDILNALYVYTHPWINTFPGAADPGMEALRIALGGLLGLRIDHYVLVDFAGFVDVIDALGGVDVTVTEPMNVGFSPAKEGEDPVRINVEPGTHHLDGRQALAYVRDRTGSSDYVRMTRQRCMLRSMVDGADPLTVMWRFGSLAEAVKSSTTTDIPLNLLPDLVRAVASLDAGSIATVAFQPPYYAPERDFKGAPIPDPARIQAAVRSVLADGAGGVRGGAAECP